MMFAIPYSSRINRRSARRKGQALLLAVLVLLFAALLGTAFVAVVAINIGQTSRQEERDKAKQAAQAGLDFANRELTYSTDAINWQPSDLTTPPLTGDASYNFYWTAFDIAQGWNSAGYVKFPDPRSENQNLSAPNYMIKVEKVIGNVNPALRDPDNQDNDKTGALRVSVIGFSPDDPNAFYKITAYKAGPAQMPLTAAMRSVSNWDFTNGVVPSATTSSAGSGTSMPITDVDGTFPDSNFYVVIGDPGSTLRSAFVTSASTTNLTFVTGTSISWSAGERVEVAATLGAPMAVDYNKDGTADPSVEKVNLALSDTAATNAPGSSRINGSLIVSGNTLMENLRDPQQASSSAAPGQTKASGLIQVTDAGSTLVSGTYSDNTSSGVQALLDSSNPSFPFSGSDSRALGIISDGANRIANSTDSTRQTEPFTPPDITSGGDGLGRYRELTKYSAPVNSGDPAQAGAYGYGQGIYINNPQDKERVYDTTASSFREMTQSEWQNLILSSATTSAYMRLGTPALTTLATNSLEEQHLRGWVNPSEFRARGALVELNPDNATITIKLDSITDGRTLQPTPDTTNIYSNYGPVPAQGWKDASGNLIGDATYGGDYSQTFAWPTDGVIFAEGNIRIRGTASNSTTDPGRSLTVVSMNNIYIEDSLNAGARKVLLLAKKNVVLNPTRVIGSIQAQTRLATAYTSGVNLLVADAKSFQVGDWIEVQTNSNPPQRQITAINTTTNTITVNKAFSSNYPVGRGIQIIADPAFNNNQPFNQYAIRVERFNDAIQRRLHLDAGTNQVRLAFRHNGERKDALTVTTQPPTADPFSPTLNSAQLENKLASTPRQSVIESSQKALKVTYDQTPGGSTGSPDIFPTTPSAPPPNQAAAVGVTVKQLASDMNTKYGASQWSYNVTVNNSYDSGSKLPLFYFLAGVGNHFDWLSPTTLPTDPPSRKDINTPASYKIPMATSVSVLMNGAAATLSNYDPVLSGTIGVTQFGFNPNYGDISSNPTNAREDVLTSDQSFYQNGSGSTTSSSYSIMQTADNSNFTLDSRQLSFSPDSSGINDLALRLNDATVDATASTPTTVSDYFNATTPAASDIPFYRFSRVKMEQITPSNDVNQITTLEPGHTIDVQAFVYAQEGGWYVIPGVSFDPKVKSTFVDLNNNGVQDAGENLDLNHDGQITRDETIAAYRYSRYNYKLKLTGAIMEKQTATVGDPDGAGSLTGAVSDWTDKWANVKVDFSSGSQVNTYGTIQYVFDDTAARDAIDTDITNTAQRGWHPPISPDWLYQSG